MHVYTQTILVEGIIKKNGFYQKYYTPPTDPPLNCDYFVFNCFFFLNNILHFLKPLYDSNCLSLDTVSDIKLSVSLGLDGSRFWSRCTDEKIQ